MAEIEEVDVGTAPKDLVFETDKVKLFRYRRDSEPTCSICTERPSAPTRW